MNKDNSAIFIFTPFAVFNKEAAPVFNNFTPENSSFLYESLIRNSIQIFQEISGIKVIYCFDNLDKEFLPADFLKEEMNLVFGDSLNLSSYFSFLNKAYFSKHENNLLVFSNVIGYTGEDMNKYLNLLKIEDESLLIGRGSRNNIAMLGFNSVPQNLLEEVKHADFSYELFLSKLRGVDYFIHTVNNLIMINDKEDFKRLYSELSKKESIKYCSHEIHENFTHLFIEYKDDLK
jgi:hypothetical protein